MNDRTALARVPEQGSCHAPKLGIERCQVRPFTIEFDEISSYDILSRDYHHMRRYRDLLSRRTYCRAASAPGVSRISRPVIESTSCRCQDGDS
jgi:hypothetical protein